MILCATVPLKVATSHTCFNEIVPNFCHVFYNGLSPHQISAPRILVIMRYGELKYAIWPKLLSRVLQWLDYLCTKFQPYV